MSWDAIEGHAFAKQVWQAHLAAGTIASAYLIAGPPGVGKRLLAREMAKALQCESPEGSPCDRCGPCGQVSREVHPDVHWLQPEGSSGFVRIEAVRNVLGRIALRPFSGRYQVVIVDGAHRLTDEAANSLLKSLEEPPAHTRFLLLTDAPARCLPTIVSRCQLIRCHPLAPEALERIVRSKASGDPAAAAAIAQLAGGSAARALELADRWTSYEHLVDLLASESWERWFEDELPEARQDVERLLDGMVAWLRDMAAVGIGQASGPVHRRFEDPLQRAAARVAPQRCVETALELVALRDSLEQFVNPRLAASLARERWLSLLAAGRS